MAKLPEIGYKISLTERAYEIIKDAIMTNVFKPGELLIEEKLAEQLAISRTPLRAALRRLAYEHLIEINSSRNATVVNISQKDVEEITIVREVLEPLAVKQLENNIKSNELKKLKNIFEIQKKAIAENNYTELIKKEYEFHVSISKFTHNKWLYEMVKDTNTIIQRYLILSGSLNKYKEVAIREHENIIHGIEEKNYSSAESSMKLHISNVSRRMLK
ncbi:GntR family transcriptional regulator [Clostridium luticellarii]|jgi:DNA-binding GntR family transcriptional regulator|uniref:Putative HTH-type transcriptional regulator YdfH n=1 Tax=Clostridium luticellarii TaxID=1691940 RepID=A0A2T0BCB7_9CLOT|nr:GntR family transcriptional regulator [Clostridium luticellarii]PRR81482.1 putative HTH-type transcriptional regulator YdfH [Clostridium luticellarii]